MGAPISQLERRLPAQPFEDPRLEVPDAAILGQLTQRLERRHARLDELASLHAGRTGDQRQVVVLAAPGVAQDPPAADPAMVDRLRIRLRPVLGRRREHPLLEPLLGGPVVRGVVREPVRVRRAVAGDHRDRLRRDALESLQEVGVDAHLDDGGGLHASGELGIGDVIAPRAEIRRSVVATQQEVRVTTPAAVEERRLEDDVLAPAHRGEGLVLRGAQLVGAVRRAELDLVDGAPLLAELREVRLLVIEAALPDQFQLGIVTDRLLELPGRAQLLERDQVVALEEAHEIGGGHDECAVGMELHGTSVAGTRPPDPPATLPPL